MDQKNITKERQSNELSEKELAMLGTTAKLSDKEIKLWHSKFISKCPSGKLDKNTFFEAFKDLYPDNNAVHSPSNLFDVIDINHDGTIDFNEFLFLAAIASHTGNLDERLAVIFDLWDVSNDKLIDNFELAHLISSMNKRAGIIDRKGDKDSYQRALNIMSKLDVNNDGKLSKNEFIQGCKNDAAIQQILVPEP